MTAPTTTAATPEELAAIRERANAATEGPWLYRPHQHDDWGTVRISDPEEPYFVARAQAGGPSDLDAHRKAKTDPYRHNGEFIAHARTDVPRLLDLIEAQRAEIERLTKERDALRRTLIDVINRGTDGGCTAEVSTEFLCFAADEAAGIKGQRDRMREALTQIARSPGGLPDEDDAEGWATLASDRREIARAALSAKEATDER